MHLKAAVCCYQAIGDPSLCHHAQLAVCCMLLLIYCLLQVLTPADDAHHINKHNFKVPFVCGCRNLGEALRRVSEGAAMIRTKVCTLTCPQPGHLAYCMPNELRPCSDVTELNTFNNFSA